MATIPPSAEGESGSPESFLDRVKRYLANGKPEKAIEIADQGLRRFPDFTGLKLKKALALARYGLPREAEAVLDTIRGELNRDEEALGLLARVHKDLYLMGEGAHHLACSREVYQEAFRIRPRPWTAINAATLAFVAGDRVQAATWANRSLELCEQGLEEDFWRLATEAEARLVLGDPEAARKAYRACLSRWPGRLGDLASTRRNAALICLAQGFPALLDELLPRPVVAVFHGPRMVPESLSPRVQDAIRLALQDVPLGSGFACANCGGDQMFLEGLMEAGVSFHLVLPSPADQFRAENVDPFPAWAGRYQRLLEEARSVTVSASREDAQPGQLDEEGLELLLSLAHFRRKGLMGRTLAVVLFDPATPTAFLSVAAPFADEVRIIRLDRLREGVPVADTIQVQPAEEPDPARREDRAFRRIRARYERVVFKVIHDRGLKEEIDEISQEVFAKVWRSIDGFEWQSELGTWIHRIAQNKITDWRRSGKWGGEEVPFSVLGSGESGDLTFEETVAAPDPIDPAAAVDKETCLSLILKGMHILSSEERETLLLRFYAGRDIRDIAAITKTPEATVKTRIHKANHKLKAYLLPRLNPAAR